MLARPTRRAESRGRTTSVVQRAVVWFLGWSLLALVGLAIGSLVIANELAKDAALREARLRGTTFGQLVAAPLVNAGVRSGLPENQARLVDVMRNRLSDGSIVHIKIWNKDGSIIWADENRLIGKRFRMAPAVHKLFGTDRVVAEFSDLSSDENVLERGEDPLLEVYVGAHDADGQPIVFESYWPTGHIKNDQRAILRRIAPLVLGGLVLFELAILPLALSLARRVDRSQSERSAMLIHALSSADRERRRIAQDLHDGLLQDLAGLGYALPAVGAQLPPEAQEARRVLADAAAVVERDMTALRTLLTDVYPADLATGGLADAVVALARQAGQAGLVVDTHLDGLSKDTPPHVAQLGYQVIREGLRNVVKHAQATRAEVRAGVESGIVTVTVLDDGRGPTGVASAPGHLGLRLLEDTLGDVGGHLVLERRETGGSALSATFPWGINSRTRA
jgi:signal transduction histidine kinase